MKHKWEIEIIDGGAIGLGEFFICHKCGASGGPNISMRTGEPIDSPTMRPFINLFGRNLRVSINCDRAHRRIKKVRTSQMAKALGASKVVDVPDEVVGNPFSILAWYRNYKHKV